MLALLLAILTVVTFAHSAPTSNATTVNIESVVEHSLEDIAGALIAQHGQNSTQIYHSANGNVHASVQPFNLYPLQTIAFFPNHHHLAVQNTTTLFNNGSVEIERVKVTVIPETTVAAISTETNIITSSAISSTSQTSTATVTVTSPKSTNSVNTSTAGSTDLVINSSEEDIVVKIKEVAADPVILSVAV